MIYEELMYLYYVKIVKTDIGDNIGNLIILENWYRKSRR